MGRAGLPTNLALRQSRYPVCAAEPSARPEELGFVAGKRWGRYSTSVFCNRLLEEVRSIRNKVMHFHPDGISDEDREITTYIPITSENRGSDYEVELSPIAVFNAAAGFRC